MSENEIDLDAIEARVAAASGGPWSIPDAKSMLAPDSEHDCPVIDHDGNPICQSPDDGVRGGHRRADAEFILHARTDVPVLVAEVRRLRALAVFDA